MSRMGDSNFSLPDLRKVLGNYNRDLLLNSKDDVKPKKEKINIKLDENNECQRQQNVPIKIEPEGGDSKFNDLNKSIMMDGWTISECVSCSEFDVLKDKISNVTKNEVDDREYRCVRCKLEATEARVSALEAQNRELFRIIKVLGYVDLSLDDSVNEPTVDIKSEAENVEPEILEAKLAEGYNESESIQTDLPGILDEDINSEAGHLNPTEITRSFTDLVHITRDSPLSICYPCKIKFEGCTFSSVLQGFLYTLGKRARPAASKHLIVKILTVEDQKALADLGVYYTYGEPFMHYMNKLLKSKAQSCSEFRESLLATGEAMLMVDGFHGFWEMDSRGVGQNKVGHLLMTLRSMIRQESL